MKKTVFVYLMLSILNMNGAHDFAQRDSLKRPASQLSEIH